MVKKYYRKQTEVRAIQWTGRNLDEAIEFLGNDNVGPIERRPNYDFFIKTPAGYQKVLHGDYIVEEVRGEFYPCKPDTFEKTYEQVDE